MPKGSKKRKAIKRKETANHHQSSTNSCSTQGNGAGFDHDSSDHPLTDEDFSPRAAMETPPDLEPDSDPDPDPEPEPVPAVSKEASVVPEPDPAVGKVASVVPEPELEPEPAVSKEVLVVSVEQQNILEPEQIETILVVATEFLDEPSVHFQVEDRSGEGSLYHEQTEVPEPKPVVSEETSDIHVEQQKVSELEQIEVAMAVEMEVLEEQSVTFQVEKKSGEFSLFDEQTNIPEAISPDVPTAGYDHLLERRASWWNCCGLLDFFGGAHR